MAGAIVGRLGRHPTSLLLLTLPRHAAAHHRLHSPSSSQGQYSKMGDPSERNGHGALTRVLFCGPYWPASTNYTREYLQDYPFIQVDEVGLEQKEMDTAVNRKDLGVPVGDTLFGKTILILGFGAIGIEVAKRLRPFGVKILATKRNWSSDTLPSYVDELVDKKGGPEDMYEFAGEANIVIACMTLTSETIGIVDHKFVSSMKKGSYLVNIARGRLLDYKAVFDHLESGHLAGLGIDVAWMEPFDPEDPVLKFPNVILTPHVAGVTEYSYRTMAKSVGDTALQLHLGEAFTEVEFVN
ncbi:uncharacterized protein [Zea mays]|uniref:uncharacterized protein isoform X3 n=1 Tax=Zea mays TaxID=4577 RepID=UPI000221D1E8|nr:uncharacterized protein LOC100217241 isoform X3 [Zea mays]